MKCCSHRYCLYFPLTEVFHASHLSTLTKPPSFRNFISYFASAITTSFASSSFTTPFTPSTSVFCRAAIAAQES
jgi:hypothetical protein